MLGKNAWLLLVLPLCGELICVHILKARLVQVGPFSWLAVLLGAVGIAGASIEHAGLATTPGLARVLRGTKLVLVGWLVLSLVLSIFGMYGFLGYLKHFERAAAYVAGRIDGDTLYLSFTTSRVPHGSPLNPPTSTGRPAWVSMKLDTLKWSDPQSDKTLSQPLPRVGESAGYSNDLSSFDSTAKGLEVRIVPLGGDELQCVEGISYGSCPGSMEEIEAFKGRVATTAGECAPCIVQYSTNGQFVLGRTGAAGVQLALVPAPYKEFTSWAWYPGAAFFCPGELIAATLFAAGYHSH